MANLITRVADGWRNVINSVNFNEMFSNPSLTVTSYSDIQRTNAYQDALIRKIVDRLPKDGMKKGFRFENLDSEIVEFIEAKLKSLNFDKILLDQWIDSRIFGESYIFMFSNEESKEYVNPIGSEEILTISGFSSEVNPGMIDKDIILQDGKTNPNFGLPKSYTVSQTLQLSGVHNSRVIRVDGERVPKEVFERNQYRNGSVIDKVYDKAAQYDLAHTAIAPLIYSFNTKILKMNNVPELQAGPSDAEDNLKKKLQLVQESIAKNNLMILFEDDEYINNSISVSGVSDLVTQIKDQLVSVSGYPRTILLGESPKGMQSSGKSELTDYYDTVSQEQKRVAVPVIRKLVNQIMLSEYGMVHDYDIYFPPIDEMTELEDAEYRLKVAQQMQIMLDSGILSEEEVRESLFRNKFSANIELIEGADLEPIEDEPI